MIPDNRMFVCGRLAVQRIEVPKGVGAPKGGRIHLDSYSMTFNGGNILINSRRNNGNHTWCGIGATSLIVW